MRGKFVRAILIADFATILVAGAMLAGLTLATRSAPALSPEQARPSDSLLAGDLLPADPPMPGVLFRSAPDAWFVIGVDTVRYRVCKDLSICFLEFDSPTIGIVTPVIPLDVGPPHLVPVEVVAMPRPTVARSRRVLLALPLLGGAGYAFFGGDDGGPPDWPGNVTPEPASLLLLGTGLAGLALHRRRRGKPDDGTGAREAARGRCPGSPPDA